MSKLCFDRLLLPEQPLILHEHHEKHLLGTRFGLQRLVRDIENDEYRDHEKELCRFGSRLLSGRKFDLSVLSINREASGRRI